jgi:protein-S-isoprenylcysteine O-methyltransferase Ste14
MNIYSILVYVLWFLSEILINRFLKAKESDKQQLDKNTLRTIWLTVYAVIPISVVISQYIFLPIISFEEIKTLGLCLVVLGCVLRLIVIKSLGKQFTVTVTIRENHQLKTDGFYAFVRHPSYAASLLSFFGFGISLNNWISLSTVMILIFWSFNRRIKIEELVLEKEFGKEYSNYKNRTKKLIPFIY